MFDLEVGYVARRKKRGTFGANAIHIFNGAKQPKDARIWVRTLCGRDLLIGSENADGRWAHAATTEFDEAKICGQCAVLRKMLNDKVAGKPSG